MTDYASMSIDNLIAYRDQWPAQRTEWNRAELALQRRLAVKHELLKLAADLDGEGLVLVPTILDKAIMLDVRRSIQASLAYDPAANVYAISDRAIAKYTELLAAAPLPAAPSSVEG